MWSLRSASARAVASDTCQAWAPFAHVWSDVSSGTLNRGMSLASHARDGARAPTIFKTKVIQFASGLFGQSGDFSHRNLHTVWPSLQLRCVIAVRHDAQIAVTTTPLPYRNYIRKRF